jgi:glycosyltransferase involved in cell wall biosynthesis
VRVLQIHNTYRQGGGEDNVANRDAELLRSIGHDVLEYRATNPERPLDSFGTLLISSWNAFSANEVGRIADEYRPDVAHVHNTWYRLSPAVFPALKKRGIPVVATIHNFRLMCVNAMLYRNQAACTDCVGRVPWRGIVRRCYRNSFLASAAVATNISVHRFLKTWSTQVDRLVVATDYLRRALVDLGVPTDQVQRLPMAVPDPGPRSIAPSQARSVLLVSRLDAEKGIGELLRLWGELDHDLELVVIGDGAERSALAAMGVPRIRFTGWLTPSAVAAEMLSARALVFPSMLVETFGLSMVEGFAAGLPVVANDTGTRSEVVGSEGAGWLVTGRSGWLRALTDLADDGAVDAAGSTARTRYEQEFSPAVVAPALERLYEDVIGA